MVIEKPTGYVEGGFEHPVKEKVILVPAGTAIVILDSTMVPAEREQEGVNAVPLKEPLEQLNGAWRAMLAGGPITIVEPESKADFVTNDKVSSTRWLTVLTLEVRDTLLMSRVLGVALRE